MKIIITDAEPEDPALTEAKKRYGPGHWEPTINVQRNSHGRITGQVLDYTNMKFWPYKSWILHNGEWNPSIGMLD